MNTQTYNKKNEPDDNMDDITVFTVPSNRPWIVTKEEAEEMFKNARKTPLTKEERVEIRRKVDKLFKKPEKPQNE